MLKENTVAITKPVKVCRTWFSAVFLVRLLPLLLQTYLTLPWGNVILEGAGEGLERLYPEVTVPNNMQLRFEDECRTYSGNDKLASAYLAYACLTAAS